MRRKALSLTSLLALAILMLAGPGTPWGSAATQRHAGHDAAVTLKVFDWGAFSGPNGPKVLKGYQKLHPNVTIKILPMPPGDPTVWEESLLAAGQAPDLLVPSYTMQVFGDLDKNYWLDLTPFLTLPDPYIPGNKHWIDSFDPTMNQQNAFVGNRYYVISWQAQDASFYYNKDMFQKAGIAAPPSTWAELLADSAKLKAAGFVPQAFDLGDTYPIAMNGSFVSVLENQVMGKTFQRLDMDHNGVIDIQELVYGIKHRIYSPMNADYQEAWKLFKDWSQYWEPNAAGVKWAPASTLFKQGKAAIRYETQGFAQSLINAKVKFRWGLFKMPAVTSASSSFATPGQKGAGIWGAWNADAWAVPVSTQKNGHLNATLDFLHWITAPQNEIPVDLDSGMVPTVKGWDPHGKGLPFFYAHFNDLLKHPSIQFVAEATLGPEWLTKRIATQQAYITGMESLQQAMADMQRYTDQAADHMIKIYHLSIK
jgi:ABC-type glycerol-3-phosphate transport system substrate-binding protein